MNTTLGRRVVEDWGAASDVHMATIAAVSIATTSLRIVRGVPQNNSHVMSV
jgi:hypothetical protein